MVPPQKEVIDMTKRKKKNKVLPLVVLVLLLLALIGAYVFLQSLPDESETDDADDAVSIPLSSYSADDIAAISYGDSEQITIVSENGVWYIEGDERFPLNQTVVSEMAESLASLAASKEVESDDLAEFGLDAPALTVNVKLTGGDEYTYSLGDVNSFNSLTYILASDKVYMFSDTLSTCFGYSKDELMLVDDSFPSDVTDDNIQSVTLRDADGTEKSCDTTDMTLSDIKECFSFENVNAYGLTEDEMSSLGFDEDGAAVIIKYSTSTDTSTDAATLDATFKILLGESDGVSVYALKDGDMTYTVDSELFEELFESTSNETE